MERCGPHEAKPGRDDGDIIFQHFEGDASKVLK